MSEPNDSFLREVKEEVRREQMKQFAEKYGVPVLVGLAVLGAAIGGYYWYSAVARDTAQKASNTLVVAERFLREERRDDAVKDLGNLAASGDGAPATLANLRLAALALEDGKPDEARKYFELVANDTDADEHFRNHARIQLVAIDIDKLSWTEAKNRLTGLTDDEDVWRHTARELLAISAMRAKQYDDAKQVLTGILGDNGAPQALRARAQMMMNVITADERAAASPEKASPSDDGSDAAKSAEKDVAKDAGNVGDEKQAGEVSGTGDASAGTANASSNSGASAGADDGTAAEQGGAGGTTAN